MVVTPTEITAVTTLSGPGLQQSEEQGQTIGPISSPSLRAPIKLEFREGMLRAEVNGFQHNTFIGPDPAADLWRIILSCFKRQEHHAAILALTPTKNSGSIASNSNMTEPRPQEPLAGVSDSPPKAWMPGDWDRR